MGDDAKKLKDAIEGYAKCQFCTIDILICACRLNFFNTTIKSLLDKNFKNDYAEIKIEKIDNDGIVKNLEKSVEVGKKIFDKLNEMLGVVE